MSEERMMKIDDVRDFVIAGNATFTLVSKATGNRFTYRVRAAEEGSKVTHFVSVLVDPDNERGYAYLGHVFGNSMDYVHGRKSKIGAEAPSAKAFAWFWDRVVRGDATAIPDSLEVWHSGHCGKCGRTLTVPESIARGIGPECARKAA